MVRIIGDRKTLRTENFSDGLDPMTSTKILGVDYHHLSFPDADDLYVTEHGLPFIENLRPENFWTDEDWFQTHSRRLKGTSTLYKVTTKEVNGKSKDIVIKWNRMGQDIPGSLDIKELDIEFNSPFEEFALVTELRNSRHESAGHILTHKPLAIYVPPAHIDLDRLGRRTYKMEALILRHDEVKLHMYRNYAVIYEWIKGIDAAEAFEQGILQEQDIIQLTERSDQEVTQKGFLLGDPKPHHVIVRPNRHGELARNRKGRFLYALVDFELLKRTHQREEEVRTAKRKAYLYKQAHRFEDKDVSIFPSNLKPVTILGVDYVYGPVEATGGALWVVGKDPALFEYFLPEKWRDMHRIRQSAFDQIYRTTTKDNVHLVWKVSRVGELPDIDPIKDEENRILQHGYNSPFEEVALALELTAKGIPTTYPRAVYMAASKSDMDESLRDDSRYTSHKNLVTPDGKPILRKNHDYIIFWGYWNGPDELLAEKDESPYQGVDALLTYRRGLLDKRIYQQLMRRTKKKLAVAGIEDLNSKGNHILLAVDNAGHLVKDAQGALEIRICNFESLRRKR
jgi:hypothetical protein